MKGDKQGIIYFLTNKSRDAIKVGFTTQQPIEKRIKQLSTGSSERLILLYTIEGTLNSEAYLHKFFSQDYQKHLEWYDYNFVYNWIVRDKITRETISSEE